MVMEYNGLYVHLIDQNARRQFLKTNYKVFNLFLLLYILKIKDSFYKSTLSTSCRYFNSNIQDEGLVS